MKTVLVVGLGMGQQYRDWLTEEGHTVHTVDIDETKKPTFTSIDQARGHTHYDIVYIGTPNSTHETLCRKIADYAKIVLVEKPGVESPERWASLLADFPSTKIMMVKNNQWRDEIPQWRELYKKANSIDVMWHNHNRIPWPGTWFTDKSRAFGGVSRDLMPHLLSYVCAISDTWRESKVVDQTASQDYQLADISDTEYGTVNAGGVLDVDTRARMVIDDTRVWWQLSAIWKHDGADRSEIVFNMADGTKEVFELGLCPKEAYVKMINAAIEGLEKQNFFFENQLVQDRWIHQQVSNFDKH